MTDAAPDLIDGRLEVYRVATDYEAICDVFRDRVEDLQATRLGVDAAGHFALGHASTLLCKPQIKGYGPESLTKMLKATGMALVFVIDDERFAAVKERLGRRERPVRQQTNASSTRPTWLFKRKKATEYGKKRWAVLSEEKRKKLARKMGKASGLARRKKAREAARKNA